MGQGGKAKASNCAKGKYTHRCTTTFVCVCVCVWAKLRWEQSHDMTWNMTLSHSTKQDKTTYHNTALTSDLQHLTLNVMEDW